MVAVRRHERRNGPRVGLRSRLLIYFLIPVLLLGVSGLLLLGLSGNGSGFAHLSGGGTVFVAILILALLISTGFAIRLGDRIARPVGWLLRMMDSGEVRLLSKSPPPTADPEIATLARRVQVLLKQNLSGAEAMEELDALRSEITAVLDAAVVGRLAADAWPREQATHPQTRRLLDFFRVRDESHRDASEGLIRLQGLLEQDWRKETKAVEEIAKRSERCFLGQTEMALELERLERIARPGPERDKVRRDISQSLADLRLGLRRWRQEVEVVYNGSESHLVTQPAPAKRLRVLRRTAQWTVWVDESLELLESTLVRVTAGNGGDEGRVSAGIEKAAQAAAAAGQEMGVLSREAARLQRAWSPLGERLRSLMVRVGEIHGGATGGAPSEEGGIERDGSH